MLLANIRKIQCSINSSLSIQYVPGHMLHVSSPSTYYYPTSEIGKLRLKVKKVSTGKVRLTLKFVLLNPV